MSGEISGTSLADWMSDADFEWRKRLQAVNLVVETDFSAEEVRVAQSKYGASVKQLRDKGLSYEEIINKHPGLTLMILVGHAALAYDQGAYWKSFWEELGLPQNLDFENALRQQAFALLEKFSLARFPDIESRKYVMTFAMHAGIPVHCLGDLLKIVDDHITRGRPARGAAVMEWLEEPGKAYRAAALDVPVQNFLVNGAQFAADILDRIIEFVEAVTDDANLLDAEWNAATSGLPTVLRDALVKQLRETPMVFDRKRLNSNDLVRPAITYNIDDDEIVLVLPVPSAGVEQPWRVSFDGEVREVHNARRWGGGSTATAKLAVPVPVHEVVLSHAESSTSVALPLVAETDPLLTFDGNGRWISRRDGLKDCVWAVFPADHELVNAETMTALDYLDVGCPVGWAGWRSVFVELSDEKSLQLCFGGNPVGAQRLVRKDTRPTFELGPTVTGLQAANGRVVHSTRPRVVLPPSRSQPAPDWNVKVRRRGSNEWIANRSCKGEAAETCIDPFGGAEHPQLGHFEILVAGPIGSDVNCVVFVAEGIGTKFDTPIRVPGPGGLAPCIGLVTAEAMSASPAGPLSFGPRDLEIVVQLHSHGIDETVILRPPHVEIRSGEVGTPAPWRMTANICDPDDFSQDRFVAIRAPGVQSVEMTYVSAFGDLLQRDTSPRKRHGETFESHTRQFVDTVRAYPAGRIVARLTTESGTIDVTVLSAQPRRLTEDVIRRDGILEFKAIAPIEDLATYVWCATAPWCEPDVLSIVDGEARLPDHLVDAGDLDCQVFVDDPWVILEPPSVPDGSAFRVRQDGWREDGTNEQVKLSRYLGSRRSAPVEVGARSEVWAALARLHADANKERFSGLVALLANEPRKALECLGDSTIPAGNKMAMLIRSELVNRKYSSAETHNELHNHPWFGCMVEIADLPSLYNRRNEAKAERAETLGYLTDRGGAALMGLLKSGDLDYVRRSCIDANVLAVSAAPVHEIEAKLREIALVPRPQLHPDNQRAGVYEALCRRSEWMQSGWSPVFAQHTAFVVNTIRGKSELAYQAIAMREQPVSSIDSSKKPWALMALQSLTLAFLARLEAHGKISSRYLNSGLLMDWARLAQLCPTMVANDLLIAEALVLYDPWGDLTGDG